MYKIWRMSITACCLEVYSITLEFKRPSSSKRSLGLHPQKFPTTAMHLSFVLPFLTFLTSTWALPYALSTLSPRFGNTFTLSSCRFDPRFLGAHVENLASRVGKAEVIITNKLTEEKGATGAGLYDNLLGECGRNQINHWQTPTVLATEPWTARVVAYSVWFDFGPSTDPSCISRAIQKAEDQQVRCTLL